MKNVFVMVMYLVAVMLISGCSTTTVCEFDKDGTLIKKTETSTDIAGSIIQSTKDKTVIMWTDGWAGYLSVSPGTMDDPTPHAKIFFGKDNRGYMGIHKDHQNLKFSGIANVIKAITHDLQIEADAKKMTLQATDSEGK